MTEHFLHTKYPCPNICCRTVRGRERGRGCTKERSASASSLSSAFTEVKEESKSKKRGRKALDNGVETTESGGCGKPLPLKKQKTDLDTSSHSVPAIVKRHLMSVTIIAKK